jgi:hypothetical protein
MLDTLKIRSDKDQKLDGMPRFGEFGSGSRIITSLMRLDSDV